MVTVGDGVLDVVGGRVNKDALIVPSSRLDAGVFLNSAKYFHFFVANGNAMFGQ